MMGMTIMSMRTSSTTIMIMVLELHSRLSVSLHTCLLWQVLELHSRLV